MVVNDNLVDLLLTPGSANGMGTQLECPLEPSYLRFKNEVTTGNAGSDAEIDVGTATGGPDAVQTVAITGSLPAGGRPYAASYVVQDPERFAAALLTRALEDAGIKVETTRSQVVDRPRLKGFYSEGNKVAEHVSPTLAEEVKVTLKVSRNLHADMTPSLIGALVADAPDKASDNVEKRGFLLEHDFLSRAGLDLNGAAQGDGAGERASVTPDFMVHYLK